MAKQTYSNRLRAHLGGSWSYDRKTGNWRDGARYVHAQHAGGFDVNGEAIEAPPRYMLQEPGKATDVTEIMNGWLPSPSQDGCSTSERG